MRTLRFDLINNAHDSLKHAVQLLAWPDTISSEKYKQSILSVYHCAELLLKERLRQINPALVWENIDKYPSLSARTVTLEKAISRLESIGGIQIESEDKKSLMACRNMRNAIQHFEFEITEKEAKVMLGKVLSFIFSFGASELKRNFEDDFKEDDTWLMLVEGLYEFANEHGSRISAGLIAMGRPVDSCSYCGQDTVDLIWESCSLCGQNHEPDEDEDRDKDDDDDY